MSVWPKAILILTLAAVFFHGKVVSLSACALLVLYFGSRYALRDAAGRLQASRAPGRLRLFPGERTTVRLALTNGSRFPLFWALVEDGVQPALRAQGADGCRFGLSLAPRGESVVEYEIEAKNRGVYSLGPMRLVTGDPLGFDEARVEMVGQTEILVYPRIYPLDALGLGGEAPAGSGPRAKRPFEDPTRMAGIRDYAPGESVRHIHWKATAHTHALKVKSFEPTVDDDLLVLLDLERERYRSWNAGHMSELAIEAAASLLAEAARRRQAFGLWLLGGEAGAKKRQVPYVDTGVKKGDAHLGACLEMLARASVGDRGGSVVEALEKAAGRTGARTTLVLIAPSVDQATLLALARIKKGGRRVLVVEANDDPDNEPVAFGIRRVRIGYRGDIARTLAGRHPIAAQS